MIQVGIGTRFSEKEIYLLLAGIYLHDIGMQCDVVRYPQVRKKAEELGAYFDVEFFAKEASAYSLSEQNEIRKNHQYISAAWIYYLHKNNDPVLSSKVKSIPNELVEDLMDICKFHTKLNITDCPELFNHNPNDRKRLIAALLRFADELDIGIRNSKIETAKIFSMNSSQSVVWWLRNHTTVSFTGSGYNKVLLKILLNPEDFEAYSSFLFENYINLFENKNRPVLDVLVSQGISIVIDSSSGIVADDHVEKLPLEITSVFDEMIKKEAFRVPEHVFMEETRPKETKQDEVKIELNNNEPRSSSALNNSGKTYLNHLSNKVNANSILIIIGILTLLVTIYGLSSIHDFSASVNPILVDINQGSTTFITVNVDSGWLYNDDVSLRAESVPPNVHVNFEPKILKHGNSVSTVTIVAEKEASIGEHLISVVSDGSDGKEHICKFTLIVNQPTPSTPTNEGTPSAQNDESTSLLDRAPHSFLDWVIVAIIGGLFIHFITRKKNP